MPTVCAAAAHGMPRQSDSAAPIQPVAPRWRAVPKSKPPAQNTAQMRKMINDTFARRKAEKMALPAPFSQADLEQPEAGTQGVLKGYSRGMRGLVWFV